MLSAKTKFEIARNRSFSSIRENLMCSSVILKNSTCLLKSSPTFENTTQLDSRVEDLPDDVGYPQEDSLRERSAKELHQYVYTGGLNPDDEVTLTSNEWTQEHDVKNEFKKGILYDKIVMSNGAYNTSIETVHSNFQINKLENVVNSIKFEENTSIKIPSYLRNSPLYVLYPELDYLNGARAEDEPEGREDARISGQVHEEIPLHAQKKNLNSYLRYTLNNNHRTGRNRMYDYFESNKKNMVEIANPNDLNHTLLYTKKNTPREQIYNLYKNRYVSNRINHTDNELSTLNTLKRLKMPFIEKNEKGENIIITSEVNAKRRVNLLQNYDHTKEKNEESTKQGSMGGKQNYTVSLIDVSSSDKASIKTVHLNNVKTGEEKKNIFQLKKNTHKDVQVQTNQEDFQASAKYGVDSDVERVMSILEGKKRRNASTEDTQVANSPRKGEKGMLSISYCDVEEIDQSGDDTLSRSDESGEVDGTDGRDEANEEIEEKLETHTNTNADEMGSKRAPPKAHPGITHVIEKYNQFLRTRRSCGGLHGTILKEQLNGPRRGGLFMRGRAHLNGAKVSPASDNNERKEPSGWDGSPTRRYNPMDKLMMGWYSPLAGGRAPLYLTGNRNKTILIPKMYSPWVHNTQGVKFTSSSFSGSRIRRDSSVAENAVTYEPSIGGFLDVYPNELRNSELKPCRQAVYIKSSIPQGEMEKCHTERPVEEGKVGSARDEECEKEKITNELLLKKLYIEKKRQMYEKRKFERAISSMMRKRAVLEERARDKYTDLASFHGIDQVRRAGQVRHVGQVAYADDESCRSTEWERDILLRTHRCARNRGNATYKLAQGFKIWKDRNRGGQEKGHVSSCSNVNLYSSNEESDIGLRRRTQKEVRNWSAQPRNRRVGNQLAEGEERNWVKSISSKASLKVAIRGRCYDKLTNELNKKGISHKSMPKFSPQSWRGRARVCAAEDKRLRSLSYKNRLSKLSVLEKSIQQLKEHARRNVIFGGNESYEKGDGKVDQRRDIIRSEVNRCVERGGHGKSSDEAEDESSGGSTDEGKKHLMDENKYAEDEEKNGIKITYNLGRIVKRGNANSHEWVHKENSFISPLNKMEGRIDERQEYRNEDQMDEHIYQRGDAQTENFEREGDSYQTLERKQKRQTSPAEKKNTMEINSFEGADSQNTKTNEVDNLVRVKVSIKKAGEGRKELDKRNNNVQQDSNPSNYFLHEDIERMYSYSYKGNASNGYIKRTGFVAKEKGNFSDTELTIRKRNSERITKKGDEPNDNPGSRTFLRKNEGHGGGDYLKIKKKESGNMRSHSHSKFYNQEEGKRETLPGIEFASKCNSPLCRSRPMQTDKLLDLERIDPNKWIQKIFGDTH
ncbi:conserved Plasmodium protein, unknown function [Plasmodium knowlesi strain H]|uniref:Uncharacterized protein n=3 Tax=Plasmodium knowlesi TaxID=5850 RepID=A0A5K1V3R0_PLAKH|nr:conserved Plasmodium protein, unknown function [Plasmodium knowlesi strain H]OTN64894.1 Uncharacterized protein PKNOH_S120134400 [Plasmodium knowlesi]CAA9988203.1 conserved Plasmodium protein, unknown function [Plasmodium knowlesi strain H]SBO20124.1 conserved Plasmodium protein, unknown function [Plasmodium knowlesi strain H]SBO20620.1 conserved Plasmodium protein, unknown function [Plasmodium knowlesi strain H]VVS77677.1 conserved Plasmodium protein, unknown function [Plasmodium knowlesi |eukprot:XP_002259180.1 hypothetical protein, conserved in Plasmodium species [Plasmodium knowlesi strain H]